MDIQKLKTRINRGRTVINGHKAVKVSNNTTARIEKDCIIIRLHNTDIVTIKENDTVLNSGGWKTITTKQRINLYLPEGFNIFQDKSVWYLSGPKDQNYVFKDGISIKHRGKVSGNLSLAKQKKAKKLLIAVNNYAENFGEKVVSGKIEPPSTGDCWYCSLIPKGTNNTHLLDHIKENYFVPSLLVTAFRHGGYGDHFLYLSFNKEAPKDRFLASMVKRVIRNYLKSNLSIAR